MEETQWIEKTKEPPDEDGEPPDNGSVGPAMLPANLIHPSPFPAGLSLERPPKTGSSRPRVLPHAKRFPTGPTTDDFRKRHFPTVSDGEWGDWHWQIRNRIQGSRGISDILRLSGEEREALALSPGVPPFAVTPYYASLLDPEDERQPLRRTVIPVMGEHRRLEGEQDDPLGEERDSPVPGLVHRYPDRVLFLLTEYCSTYCRYCTRSRVVGNRTPAHLDHHRWEQSLAYIEGNPAVRDVLLSGGDPLTLPNDRLEWLLSRLRRIPHVEFLRIGTKVPVVLPQRVTHALTRILKRYHPLWMSVHFTHPDELTPETTEACSRLADAGIPLGSQTVLLAGVNDDVETMRRLFRGLLKIRVKPYYLYQCDPLPGTSHFRTPVEKGLEIIKGLRGHTTGYAVPTFVVDAPAGGGKIPLLPDYLAGRDGDELLLRNYVGEVYRYPDPGGKLGA